MRSEAVSICGEQRRLCWLRSQRFSLLRLCLSQSQTKGGSIVTQIQMGYQHQPARVLHRGNEVIVDPMLLKVVWLGSLQNGEPLVCALDALHKGAGGGWGNR